MKRSLGHLWLLPLSAALAAAGLLPLPAGWGVSPAPALAQEEKKEEAKPDEATEAARKKEVEFRDTYFQFVSYLLEQNRFDIAAKMMEALMKAEVPTETFVKVFELNQRALQRLEFLSAEIPEIEARLKAKNNLTVQEKQLLELCAEYPKFWKFYSEKRREVALNPERIKEMVKRLNKSEPVYLESARQLAIAGPFAIPAMVDELSVTEDRQMVNSIARAIRSELQSKAVDGLVVALRGSKNDNVKRLICELLGELGYAQAIPYLKEAAEDKGQVGPVREAAQKSFDRITTPGQKAKTVSQLYLELADAYFADRVTPRPASGPVAEVWVWEQNRVVPKKVSYDAYADALARRYAWDALRTAPDNEYAEAWATFLCAFHRFESDQAIAGGGKVEDPLKGVEKWLDSTYTTVSAGPARIVKALKKGLDVTAPQTPARTQMIVRLLQHLSTVGGRNALYTNPETLEVISSGLTHPNQVVRIETAINAVRMRPDTPGPIWSRVPPALGEAVMLTGKETVLVIVANTDQRNALVDALREGYKPVPAKDLAEAQAIAREQAGFAFVLAVPEGDPAAAVGMVNKLNGITSLTNSAKVILTTPEGVSALSTVYPAGNAMGVYGVEMAKEPKAVAEFAKSTVKPKISLTAEQSQAYTLAAIELLGRMAEFDAKVFNWLQGQPSLVSALDDEREPVAAAAAKSLGLFPTQAAQQALAKAGAKKGREPVQIAALYGLAESGRKHGRLLNEKFDARLLEDVSKLSQDQAVSQELRNAASSALGALTLPPGKLFELLKAGAPASAE